MKTYTYRKSNNLDSNSSSVRAKTTRDVVAKLDGISAQHSHPPKVTVTYKEMKALVARLIGAYSLIY